MKKSLLLFALILLQNLPANAQGIDKPRYIIETHRAGVFLGNIEIELFPLIAPLATNYFDSLVNVQAFDSTAFHRVVPGFVIQGGDPNSINGPKSTWGYGNPNQPTVNAEFSVVRHLRGRIGAAREANDTNSATSQFYICAAAALFLDGQYTVYGQVTSGMSIADNIVNSPRDANDCPLQKIEMFITHNGVNDSIPDAPQLISPANNAAGILNGQMFDWTAVSSAVMYTVEFSTDPAFSTIAFWKNTAIDSTTYPTFTGGTVYYWRVKSNNGGHENSSPVYSFTSALSGPVLVAPHDTATGVYLNPVFSWNAAPGATEYTLQVAKINAFTGATMIYNQSGLTGTSQQVSGLQTNHKYYWRVQSSDGTNPGNFSTKFSFTTGTLLGVDNIKGTAQNIELKNCYPNPAKDLLHAAIAVKHPCTITLNLKNNAGKIVYTAEKKIAKTDYTETIDVSKLSKGVYFITVGADGEEVSKMVEVN